MRKKTPLFGQLLTVTWKIAEAFGRCVDREGRFDTCMQSLSSICHGGEVKKPASLVETEALVAAFDATLDGRPGHQHIAAAARLIAQVWIAVESFGNHNLPKEIPKTFKRAQRELREGEPGISLDNYTSGIAQ